MNIVDILEQHRTTGDYTKTLLALWKELTDRNVLEVPLISLPPEIATFVLVRIVQDEINNGGIVQFFFDGNGEHADGCVQALRTIGADMKAYIVETAMASFPEGKYPRTVKEYEDVLESLGDDDVMWSLLEELDEQFYDSPEDTDILLVEFVIGNVDKFSPK